MTKLFQIALVLGLLGLGFSACKGGKDLQEKEMKFPTEDAYKSNFHAGILEKMRGNFDLAEGHFLKCLTINAQSDAAHFALSDLHELMGKPETAMTHAQQAYDIDPDNKWYVLRLADLNFKKGNYHKASEYFEKVIADEKNIDLKFKYAEALIYSKKQKRAIEMLDEIEVELGMSPNLSLTKHDLYREMGDEEGANKELQKLIEDNPNSIENRLVIADYFLRTNQVAKASIYLDQVLEINPKNGEAQLMLADIALRSNDLTKSLGHLEKGFAEDDVSIGRKINLIKGLEPYAFSANPDAEQLREGLGKLYTIIYDESLENDTLHYSYGIFLRELGEGKKAVDQFEKVTLLNPDNYNAWRQLLFMDYELERFDRMASNGEKAIEVFPAQPDMYLLTAIGYLETQQFDKAEEWLFLGQDLVVNDIGLKAEFVHQKGRLESKKGNYEKALDRYNEARKIDPQNGNVYISITETLLQQSNSEEAMKLVNNALTEAPTNAYLMYAKAKIFFHDKKYERTINQIENALIYNVDPQFHELKGDAHFQQGEKDKALEEWKKAKETGRDTQLLNKKINDQQYYEK